MRIRLLVASLLLAFCASVVFASVLLAQPAFPATVRVTTNSNLRSGPGTGYARVGRAATGTALTVTGCNDACDWYQLDNGNWIAAFLVVEVEAVTAEPPSPAESAPASPTTTGATANRNSNLRAGPGTGYAIVGSARSGQALNVVARNGDSTWYKLDSGAWIAAFLVNNAPVVSTVEAGLTTPAPTATPERVCEPSYPDFCVPVGTPDLDCGDLTVSAFRVYPPDPHRFDADNDGIGCEVASDPPPAPAQPAAPVAEPAAPAQPSCDPNYAGACIPVVGYDLDCGEISARRFQSVGSDPHRFDGDNDGIACESN